MNTFKPKTIVVIGDITDAPRQQNQRAKARGKSPTDQPPSGPSLLKPDLCVDQRGSNQWETSLCLGVGISPHRVSLIKTQSNIESPPYLRAILAVMGLGTVLLNKAKCSMRRSLIERLVFTFRVQRPSSGRFRG